MQIPVFQLVDFNKGFFEFFFIIFFILHLVLWIYTTALQIFRGRQSLLIITF